MGTIQIPMLFKCFSGPFNMSRAVKLKEHEKNIYVSDISSVSISFRDAPKHTMEEIIRTFKAADRINKLAKK